MVKIFAHRGASGAYPENTLVAFREAVRMGADAIELDVQLSRDRELIVFHDETLERTTGLSGRVIDWKLAAIQKMDVGERYAPEFAGEHIPSLQEVFEAVPSSILLNIHVIAHSYSRKMLATRLVQYLHEADAWERCFITSDARTLKQVHRLHPGAKICSLTRFPNPSDYLRHSMELGCRIVQPLRQMLNAHSHFVEEAHQRGLTVNVVYANTEDEMLDLIEMEVDGIFTNDPGLLRKVLDDSQV